MPNVIESVSIKGFRSLAEMEITNLPRSTVLVGANASGKSNVMQFFEMMGWMLDMHRLRMYVARHGGADDHLFGGRKVTSSLEAQIAVRTGEGRADYRFELAYADDDQFVFSEEAYRFTEAGQPARASWERIDDSGYPEAKITDKTRGGGARPRVARALVGLFHRCLIYQFHDTSFESKMKVSWDATDSGRLRGDGANLASVVLLLEREDKLRLDLICHCIGLAVPQFDCFRIEKQYGKAMLRWKMKEVDETMRAHQTSDGMLRLLALATLLNLPPELLPDVLLLDNPDLGLHPAAITVVGSMIEIAAGHRQVVVATQSPLLVDNFKLDEIVVLEPGEDRTTVRRFKEAEYAHWLDEYSTGELWMKNLLGGRP